ncbi:O-antigen polysaccharide polymerase Wzy family protein [Tessaracoccus massiliensis]|uniref:O-antigen polysaccharide polymerase Wzy family protein n=1 Tax=Tessaracoccus massiliensis TaxID=1522311 RepID=UPI00058F4EDE|nr:O-antigen polysaccharide polymerase Wzy family protein [Tessaracoccus massiliensis]
MALVWLAANLILGVLVLASGATGVWSLVLFCWMNLLFVALSRLTQRPFFAGFLLCFFLFLMTYDTFERVFKLSPPQVSEEAHALISAMLVISLLGLAVGYFLPIVARRRPPDSRVAASMLAADASRGALISRESVRSAALLAFALTVPLAIVSVVLDVLFVRSSSYAATYTESFAASQGGVVGTVLTYSSELAAVAFAIYLATMPRLRTALVPLVLWGMYSGLHLLTGRRAELAVLLLFLLCYGLVRNRITPEDPWVTRRRVLPALLLLPLLLVLFAGLESWRGVGNASGFSLSAVPEFFHGQGVTVKVLENVALYGDALPEQQYLLEFLHRGIPARIAGQTVFEGNSVTRAMEGGSLSHSLSYLVLGQRYLDGQATGSSYIAEAFVDFGFGGVLVVSIVIGLLIAWVDRAGGSSVVADAVRFIAIQSILWSPRGSATGFVSAIVAPSTLVGVSAIALVAMLNQRLSNEPKRTRSASRAHQRAI